MNRRHALSLGQPFVLLVALLLTSPATTRAQDESARFGEVVDVTLVNVEVWVSDRKGRAVLGLTAEDFEVLEDGRPVPITYFNEVGAASLSASPSAPPAGTPEAPALAIPEPPGHWVFYFDQLHLTSTRQKGLIEDVRNFLVLSRIPPQRVLVLRQGRDLVPEAYFGSTREELEGALARIAAEEPAQGQLRAQAKRLAVDRLQQLWETLQIQSTPDPCSSYPLQAMAEINRYTRESVERSFLTLGNLHNSVSFLGAVPGVKTLIYAGDALETYPGSDLLQFVDELCPTRTDRGRFKLPEGLGPDFRELTRDANANRVTIYTLQTGGLRSSDLQRADQRSLTLAAATTALGSAIRASDRSGLEYMAVDTGGRAILNRNRFETALEEISREMSSYYSLAYEPPHGGDGLEHRIKVRVRGDGLVTRHRLNYHDKSPAERLVERLQSALYLGVSNNPMELRLGAGRLTATDSERFALRLHILVPAGKVAFLQHEGSPQARLEATVAIRTPERPRPEIVQRVLPVSEPPAGDEAVLDLVMPLELEPGPKFLAVALRDQATNETSFVSTTVDILPPAPTER